MKRLVLAALLVLATACGEQAGRSPEPQRPFAWPSLPGGWTALPEPPFARARAASVWTGHELLHWGGDTEYGGVAHADGAVFDPDSKAWRLTAPAPIGPRSAPAAVWTGSEVLIWGGWADGGKADGAAYDLAADTWRPLSESPLSGRVPVAAAWTGVELIVWGDMSRSSEDVDGAAYEPASDTWRKLAPAPFALNEAEAVWTGKELVVYGAVLDGKNRSETEHAQGMAYDLAADTWREIAPYPLSPQASTVVWTGQEMIAWDYELQAAAYDPASDSWRHLPDLPLEFSECYPEGVLGEGIVFAWHCGRAALLDLADSSWRVVPAPGDAIVTRPVAAESIFLFAGASHEGQGNALWAYRPEGDTSFVPNADEQIERSVLPLVFPDGTRVALSYPRYLDLPALGVQPDASYLYRDDPAARFALTFVHGPATARPTQVALRAGSWTILAPLREPAEKQTVERGLRAHETADGFPVIEAVPPLALSREFGEGGGVQLALGDLAPKPAVVSSLDPLILLAPGGCRLPEPEISDGHGAKCLGQLYLGVYGDRPFVEEALAGMRLEDQ